MRTWPPVLGDNDLAVFGIRKEQLEHKFMGEPELVTRKKFPEIRPEDHVVLQHFTSPSPRKITARRILNNETIQKVDALAYLREKRLRDE